MELTESQQRVLVLKVLPYTRSLSGDELDDPVRKAIGLTYPEKTIQEAGLLIAHTIDRNLHPQSGADDKQLPAISKLPPLIACYFQQPDLEEKVESAVRVTNDNDEAVAWARCAGELLKQCYLGVPLADALVAAQAMVPGVASLAEAQAMAGLDAVAAGDSFGRTCHLDEAPLCQPSCPVGDFA